MKLGKVAIVAVLTVTLASCTGDSISKQTAGQVVGGVAGAVIGSQFGSGTGRIIATAVGTLAGVWIGGEIGKRLDQRDRSMMSNSTNQALNNAKDGETVTWHNPESGHSGATMPTSTYKTSDGAKCRNFSQSVQAGGEQENRSGAACQQADGSWKISG